MRPTLPEGGGIDLGSPASVIVGCSPKLVSARAAQPSGSPERGVREGSRAMVRPSAGVLRHCLRKRTLCRRDCRPPQCQKRKLSGFRGAVAKIQSHHHPTGAAGPVLLQSGHPRQRLQMDGTADNRADRTIQESRIADLKTITRSQAASILEPTPCARPTRLRLHARQDSASRRPTLLTVAAQAAAASAPLTTKWS